MVQARTCFLLTLKLCTPNKDKLFYGGDKVSHYYLHYQIQVTDRHVCDNNTNGKINWSIDFLRYNNEKEKPYDYSEVRGTCWAARATKNTRVVSIINIWALTVTWVCHSQTLVRQLFMLDGLFRWVFLCLVQDKE